MSVIQNVIEPRLLYLAWQAPEGPDRTRYLIGEVRKLDSGVNFRYLSHSEPFLKAEALGFKGFPAFKIAPDKVYSEGVVEAFLRRIPPKTRGDFKAYLAQYCLPTDIQLSELTLLGYTGAKLPTDGFSIVNPFEDVEAPCELLLEVAGFRYTKAMTAADIRVGTQVMLVSEPENPYDVHAIKLQILGNDIGYIPRGLTNAFHRWIRNKNNLSLKVERLNGTNDRPLVYVFVEVR